MIIFKKLYMLLSFLIAVSVQTFTIGNNTNQDFASNYSQIFSNSEHDFTIASQFRNDQTSRSESRNNAKRAFEPKVVFAIVLNSIHNNFSNSLNQNKYMLHISHLFIPFRCKNKETRSKKFLKK